MNKTRLNRVLSLALAAVMLLGCLAGCGKDTGEALAKLTNYVNENGRSSDAATAALIDLEAGLKDTTVSLAVVNDDLLLMVEYDGLSVGDVENSCITNLHLGGDKKGEFAQQNSVEYSGSAIKSKLTGSIDLASYTPSTEIDGEFSSTLSTSELTDDFKAYVVDGINTGLEVLSEFLADKLELTLSDIGFSKYEIDTDRESAIREHNDAPDEPKTEPAPVSISIEKLSINSLSTSEVTLRVTNNSDKALVALNMCVVCFDAYGEQMKQYGSEYGDPCANLRFEYGLAPGETSDSLTYTLSGFEAASSIQVAVFVYKLDGGDKVTIATDLNDPDLVWVKYPG